MCQGSHALSRSLTLETLDDESAVRSFGLDRPEGQDEAGMVWQQDGRWALHQKRSKDGRITQWQGAFLVTTDQRSLRDRTPALARQPINLAQKGTILVFPITTVRFGCLQCWETCTLLDPPQSQREKTKFRDGHAEARRSCPLAGKRWCPFPNSPPPFPRTAILCCNE